MKRSDYTKQSKALWIEACKLDGINNDGMFIIFKDGNPYDEKKLKLTNDYNLDTLREKISNLSSSPYYQLIEDWYAHLTKVLKGFTLDPLPTITTTIGNAHIKILESTRQIYFTWYQMPETGHWEIICYLT